MLPNLLESQSKPYVRTYVHHQQKEIKKLKIRAEELRKMANQYKRNFGKSEREQRNLLLKEVKNIRKEIKDLRNYYAENLTNL